MTAFASPWRRASALWRAAGFDDAGKIIGGGMPSARSAAARDHGTARTLGSCLPSGTCQETGGDDGRHTNSKLISAPEFHQRLGAMTDVLVERLATRRRRRRPLATNHVCGMFGFFFTTERDVDRYER